MASKSATKLKKTFSEAPEELFETLTFGELERGESFIPLPLPGDNSIHGGFKEARWVFVKTVTKVKEAKPGMPYAEESPHGAAKSEENQRKEIHFPHAMPVIVIRTK